MGSVARTPEFVRAFRELFDGRRDIHGEPLGSARGGFVKEEVTDDVVRDHLDGRRRIGIYTVVGSRVKWCCVDLDIPGDIAHGWTLAKLIAARLRHYGFAPLIERTRTKGWHVWLFFAGWIEAWKVRRVVEDLVVKLDLREHLTVPPLQSPVEVFPKQDRVPEGGAGNYVNLPLHGEDAPEGRTCFYAVAPDGSPALLADWTPFDVEYTTEAAVDELIELSGIQPPTVATPRPVLAPATSGDGTHEVGTRKIQQLWPCGLKMLKDGVGEGSRNECTFRLAVQFKHLGYTLDETLAQLAKWNDRCAPPTPAKEFRQTVASAYDPRHKAESYGCDKPQIVPFCVKCDCAIYRKDHPDEAKAAGYVDAPKPECKPDAVDDPNKVAFESVDLRSLTFVLVRPAADLKYSVVGLDNRGKGGALKASFMRIDHKGGMIFSGSFNLSSPRTRRELGKELFDAHGVTGVDVDLMNVHDSIMRRMQEELSKVQSKEAAARQNYALTEQEGAAARAWAKEHPHPLYDAIELTSRAGLVREKKNRALLLLAFTSRKMDNPINAIGKGDSSSGKSFLASTMLKLIPDEDVREFTRVTAAALFYGGESSLQNKVVYIREAPGGEDTEHSLRTFMSENDLKLLTVQKDESTGRNRTEEVVIKGPICFYTTTTSVEVNPENETRLLTITSDESEATTRAFLDPKAYQAQFGPLATGEDELKTWKNFQRVLDKGLLIVVPYALHLCDGFPTQNIRARRDFAKMIELIRASAFLHQFHRRREPFVDDKGQPRETLYASVADYEIVKSLVEESVMRTNLGIKPGQEAMLDAIEGLSGVILEGHARGERTPHAEVDVVGGVQVAWLESSLLRQQLGKTQRSTNALIRSLEDDGLVVTAKEKKPLRVRLASAPTGDGVALRLRTVDPDVLYAAYPEDRKDSYKPTDAPDFHDLYRRDDGWAPPATRNGAA